MSSRKGGGSGSKLPSAGSTESVKGKNVAQVSDRWADQVADRVSAVSLDSEKDGVWEEVARKPKNRSVGNVGSQNSSAKVSGNPWTGAKGPSNAWAGTKQPVNAWAGKGSANTSAAPAGDYRRAAGRGWNQSSSKEYVNHYDQPAVIPPPLEKGWQWRSNPSQVEKVGNVPALNPADATDEKEEENYDDKSGDEEDFNTEDIYDSDEYDSDESQKSHETLKKSSLLKGFFETLDDLKVDEINEPDRQWHCPACHGGPGAIDWYRGLQPLMTHAKTKGKRRAKAHRVLAKLLDEELRRRGTSVIPSGEAFGKWKGLNENAVRDKEIVWPPMVIIMNTQLDKDDNGKWLGMGNAELLDYFNTYAAVRSRHSYGPQGHRGMSVLIFESSAVGYLEAERLSKHFEEEGTDREAWDRRQKLFLPGGQRLLYGYMAEKGDIDKFNLHSQGKSKLKFDMRSYEEMVVNPMKQMNEDNHLLNWYKNKAVKEKKHSKALEESFGAVSEKLRKTLEENRIVRQRTKMHHEQNKEEMDYQEEFYKEQLRLIHEARNEREENFEKIQQEKREKMKIYMEIPSSAADRQSRINSILVETEKGWQWRSNPFQVEKVGNVPALNPADATDDKEEENYDKTQLLKLIQNFPEGIAVADLKDAYPSVEHDLKALKAAGEIWLSNFDSAAEEDMAYPNNHRAIKVDDDLKQLFRGIELPRDMIDIEKDLQKHGMKPATNTAQRRASNKPEQKKKKKRGISKRSKLN